MIDNPQAIRIRDASLRTRWERLYEAPPIWSARQIAYLGRRAGDQAFTLLAWRLVYRGEPWGRGRSVNARQWGETGGLPSRCGGAVDQPDGRQRQGYLPAPA